MRIGEAAELARVNVQTLRYYERTGDLPPKPIFWMHQLGGLNEDKYLDPDVFAAQTNAALKVR